MIQIRCTNCNKDFSIDKEKCPYCGDPVHITSKFYCGDCEKEMDISEHFCHNCNKIPKEVIIQSKDGRMIRTSFITSSDDNYGARNDTNSFSGPNPLFSAFVKCFFFTILFAIIVHTTIFAVVSFSTIKQKKSENAIDDAKREVFISAAHRYISSVKQVVNSSPELLECGDGITIKNASPGDYYVSIKASKEQYLFANADNNSGYIIIHKKKTESEPVYSYSIYFVDMYDTGLAFETNEEDLDLSSLHLYNYLSHRNYPDDSSIKECKYVSKK